MLVMGILNLTPDSFADGGRHNSFEAGVARGLEMIAEGVDIIDIGGESTRPGADRVSAEEEQARVLPVIKELAKSGVKISIDTMRADTAEKAVQAGAAIINDVSGGLSDPAMFATVKKLGVPYILMHWRGESKDMQSKAIYQDVVKEVKDELDERVTELLKAGVLAEQKAIVLGQFSSYKLTPHDKGFKLQSVVDWLRTQIKTPVLTDLPFGHVPTKLCLPVGQKIDLVVEDRDALLLWAHTEH